MCYIVDLELDCKLGCKLGPLLGRKLDGKLDRKLDRQRCSMVLLYFHGFPYVVPWLSYIVYGFPQFCLRWFCYDLPCLSLLLLSFATMIHASVAFSYDFLYLCYVSIWVPIVVVDVVMSFNVLLRFALIAYSFVMFGYDCRQFRSALKARGNCTDVEAWHEGMQ